jgi:hypothetical protein
MIIASQTETLEINTAPVDGRRSIPFAKAPEFIESCFHTQSRQVTDVVRR